MRDPILLLGLSYRSPLWRPVRNIQLRERIVLFWNIRGNERLVFFVAAWSIRLTKMPRRRMAKKNESRQFAVLRKYVSPSAAEFTYRRPYRLHTVFVYTGLHPAWKRSFFAAESDMR